MKASSWWDYGSHPEGSLRINPEKHHKLWFVLAPLAISFSIMNTCNQQWWTSLHYWRNIVGSNWVSREISHQTFLFLCITMDMTVNHLQYCTDIQRHCHHWAISVLMNVKIIQIDQVGRRQKCLLWNKRKKDYFMFRNMK